MRIYTKHDFHECHKTIDSYWLPKLTISKRENGLYVIIPTHYTRATITYITQELGWPGPFISEEVAEQYLILLKLEMS